ncbi:hypothetical protein DEU56DRAFT_910211 [Suillus clintonianus]|uniref:uncharacterized protein n=1 Tax=Suillus clintonianus TaxID=1904413 RepID=UPI001B881D7B|nr:uncharacterized protein DEU56DRAFT_910211 [Suillus clintonianus]KAG2145923.1 hypothetical protein DEU56DRAFT_910211 [Suillus clintonianus]
MAPVSAFQSVSALSWRGHRGLEESKERRLALPVNLDIFWTVEDTCAEAGTMEDEGEGWDMVEDASEALLVFLSGAVRGQKDMNIADQLNLLALTAPINPMEPPSSPSSTITAPPDCHETALMLAKLSAEAMICHFALLHYDSVSKSMIEWCW